VFTRDPNGLERLEVVRDVLTEKLEKNGWVSEYTHLHANKRPRKSAISTRLCALIQNKCKRGWAPRITKSKEEGESTHTHAHAPTHTHTHTHIPSTHTQIHTHTYTHTHTNSPKPGDTKDERFKMFKDQIGSGRKFSNNQDLERQGFFGLSMRLADGGEALLRQSPPSKKQKTAQASKPVLSPTAWNFQAVQDGVDTECTLYCFDMINLNACRITQPQWDSNARTLKCTLDCIWHRYRRTAVVCVSWCGCVCTCVYGCVWTWVDVGGCVGGVCVCVGVVGGNNVLCMRADLKCSCASPLLSPHSHPYLWAGQNFPRRLR
jgi:hypothetical protein